MKIEKPNTYSGMRIKNLLFLFIFFGFISFTGFAKNPCLKLKTKIQKELFLDGMEVVKKGTVSYHIAGVFICETLLFYESILQRIYQLYINYLVNDTLRQYLERSDNYLIFDPAFFKLQLLPEPDPVTSSRD